MIRRKTIAREVKINGLGLHSGTPATVTIHPSQNGIAFRLGSDRFQAIPENVSDTTRCTRLGSVSTIEHIMSAFAGLEITDAEVELTAPELPGLDGSSQEYVLQLLNAGFEFGEEEPRPSLYRRIFLQEDNFNIAVAKGTGHWRYSYNTGSRWPGLQSFETSNVLGDYQTEIAPARTFALEEEMPMIRQAGLGKGLDETSALLLGNDAYLNECRFSDEPARHKLLDLIGDLYLAGIPIGMLSVVAEKSGHTANVKAAAMLRQAIQPTG